MNELRVLLNVTDIALLKESVMNQVKDLFAIVLQFQDSVVSKFFIPLTSLLIFTYRKTFTTFV